MSCHLLPQRTRKAASNQSSLTFFLVLLKWFRISGCQYLFFKEVKRRTSSVPGIQALWGRCWMPSHQWDYLPHRRGWNALWGGRNGMPESWEHWVRSCLSGWKHPGFLCCCVNSWPLGEELPGVVNTSHLPGGVFLNGQCEYRRGCSHCLFFPCQAAILLLCLTLQQKLTKMWCQ